MKQIILLFACALIGYGSFAQPKAVIKKATSDPVIDGKIDDVWATVAANNIDLPFQSETPTVGKSGATTWKALWNTTGIFVLLQVDDNIFFPAYDGQTPDQNWMYDKPEIYFDVNADLQDGVGSGGGKGHIQIAPGFTKGKIKGDLLEDNTVQYAFWVKDPSYVAEYFIPFDRLTDRDGVVIDISREVGFDVTIIDTDDEGGGTNGVRNRSVWANIGGINESYSNMDDCGIITFEGAEATVKASSIKVTGEGGATTITTDNGTLQMIAEVLPANAAIKTVKWSIANGTGKATISSGGLVSAVDNGIVTVTAAAKDGSGVKGTLELTISGQTVEASELNILNDGSFATDGPLSGWADRNWGAWSGNGGTVEIIDGVAIATPVESTDVWNLQLEQHNYLVENGQAYTFTFKAWADADRNITITMEDPANSYNRFGSSSDPDANGRSDWTIAITTEPTTYTRHVFVDDIRDNTDFKFDFQLAATSDMVYIDDVVLINDANIPSSVASYDKPKFTLYPNPVTNEIRFHGVEKVKTSEVYSITGALVKKVTNVNQNRIDVKDLSNGMYLLKIQNNQSIYTQKFIIKR